MEPTNLFAFARSGAAVIALKLFLFPALPNLRSGDGGLRLGQDAGNQGQPLSSDEIYLRAVQSTVWVGTFDGDQLADECTGVLVDSERRLVMTTYHAIRNAKAIKVLFPKFQGREVAKQFADYENDFIVAKVWASDPTVDLAVLEVPRTPSELSPLSFSAMSPSPGAPVHMVSGREADSFRFELWLYSHGVAREVVWDTYRPEPTQAVTGWMIRAQIPMKPGVSGSPLVNDRAELLGIALTAVTGESDVGMFIDARKIKELLANGQHGPPP